MTDHWSQWYERNIFEPMLDFSENKIMKSRRADILKDLKAEDSILEVGSGSGLNIPHYPASVTRLTALGLSAEASLRAVQKAKKRDLTLEYHKGDGHTLPFADASFDAVVSTLILCTVDEPIGFLSEIFRVLKPGGRFLFFEHAYVPQGEGGSSMGCALATALRPLHKAVAMGCDITRPFPRDVLKDAGFRTVWQKEEWVPLHAGKFIYGVLSK